MTTKSLNPYNQEVIKEYNYFTDEELATSVDNAEIAYKSWKKTTFSERAKLLQKVAKDLKENAAKYAVIITKEMGKPITQAKGEVEKCAWVCEYYAENAEQFLSDKIIATDATKSFVKYESIGCVLAVMPWNYPFWQLFRFAAPALMAGNVAILKHASNVCGSALLLEEIFNKAGYPKGAFQTVIAQGKQIEKLLEHKGIKAVTLTGSEAAGKAVASKAGEELKKSVLELGGSNALMVFEDADIKSAAKTAAWARFQNTGQSCIAAKRFIVVESVYEDFLKAFEEEVKAYKIGDPMNEATEIGPMARADLAEELEEQMQDALDKGAKLILGGKRKMAHFEPTIIGDVTDKMRAYQEELFGPVATFIKVKSEDEAIKITNSSSFGLGASIFSKNPDRLKRYISEIEDGAVFINELVKSDPRLPFGGTKNSGYGRELSEDGILEFVNRKTVYIK